MCSAIQISVATNAKSHGFEGAPKERSRRASQSLIPDALLTEPIDSIATKNITVSMLIRFKVVASITSPTTGKLKIATIKADDHPASTLITDPADHSIKAIANQNIKRFSSLLWVLM